MVKSAAGKKKNVVASWKEVAKHNKFDDSWIIIDGKIYDVTKWMDNHPGGAHILQVAAGRDCSILFKTYHSESAYGVLPKFEVGTVSDTELPQFAKDSQTTFYPEIKRRLNKYFKAENINPKNSVWIWMRYACIVGTVLGCSYGWLAYRDYGLMLGIVLSIIQGFACALIGLMPLHDGSHFSITTQPWVWQFCMHLHDFLNGASSLIWTYQHILGHHPYTNIEGTDPDIDTAEHDIRRIKKSQPWYSHYLSQHIYTPIAYGLLAWKTRYQDIAILYFSGSNGSIRVNKPSPMAEFLFWAGKATWFTYRILIPSLYLPLWQVLFYLTIADFVVSYWLALTFQANHVVDEVDWVTPDENNLVHADWAAHQLATTQDYSHDNWLMTTTSGALNYQSTHHLVPGFHQFYYPKIAKVIQEVAKEYKVEYKCMDTFHDALGSHLSYLKQMGQKPKKAKAN